MKKKNVQETQIESTQTLSFVCQDKDTELLLSDKTSKNDYYNRPLSIMRLLISSNLLNDFIILNYSKNESANYEVKEGCTCIATKVCGKTLGEIVNPLLNRSFNKR